MSKELEVVEVPKDMRIGVIIGYARGRARQAIQSSDFSNLSDDKKEQLEHELIMSIYYKSMSYTDTPVEDILNILNTIPISTFMDEFNEGLESYTIQSVRSPEEINRSMSLVEHLLIEGIESVRKGKYSARKFEILESKFSELGFLRWVLNGEFDKSIIIDGVSYASSVDIRRNILGIKED